MPRDQSTRPFEGDQAAPRGKPHQIDRHIAIALSRNGRLDAELIEM